jgi:hypothetical protein
MKRGQVSNSGEEDALAEIVQCFVLRRIATNYVAHSFVKAQFVHSLHFKLSSFNGALIYVRKEKALSAPLRCY